MTKVSVRSVLSRVSRYIEVVLDSFKRNDSVIFEAYPGFGKSFLGLSVLRAFNTGLYVTRTIAEMNVVMNIGELMNIDIRPLYGRTQLCTKFSSIEVVELFYKLCRAHRVVGLCKESTEKEIVDKFSSIRDPEEVKALGKALGVCPYRPHLLASLSKRYVVTTYEFVVHHRTLRQLDRDVAIYDECHSILDLVDLYVQKLDRYELTAMAENIRNYFPKLAYILKSVAKRCESVDELLDTLVKVVEEGIEGSELFDDIVSAYLSNRVYIDRDTDTAYLLVKHIELELGRRKLYMTAYVPPFLITKKVFVRVEDPPLRIPVTIDTSLTSRYTARGPDFAQKLAEVILQYIDRGCANLIVLPSKKLSEDVERILLAKGFRIAPPQAIDKVSEGTLVIDVAGGIATEGITPSKALKRVIVAGMPYPAPDPKLNVLAKVYGFNNVYTYIALLRTVQAVGRLMRWGGTAVLIDSRFAEYRSMLPSWIEVTEVV